MLQFSIEHNVIKIHTLLFTSSDLVADDFETYFAQKFRRIASYHEQAYGIEIDVEEEITKYQQLALEIKPFVCETVSYLHEVLSSGKKVLVEGANASMLVYIPCFYEKIQFLINSKFFSFQK